METTMPLRCFVLPCLTFALAAGAVAQKPCPYTKADRIPASEQYGPAAACSGLSFSGHGFKLATATGCPLFVTLTPQHHDIVPNSQATRAEKIGTREGRILYFRCQTDYVIIIPWGSSCVCDRDVAWGTYLVAATRPCEGQ
jgi:hypothetical protein